MESVAYNYMHAFTVSKRTFPTGGIRLSLILIHRRSTPLKKAQATDPTTAVAAATTSAEATSSAEVAYDADGWPKGPYTQQIQGVLPAIITDDIITTHLKSSGKQLQPKKRRKVSEDGDSSTAAGSYSNVDYSTLHRGHQYFMESYIPGRYVRFCSKEGQIWIKARCYRSQKKMIPCILLMLHWPVKPHTMLLMRYVLAQQGSPECAVTWLDY